ncbi:MAG: hypothetical protein ACTHON_18190 [Humibacter sp.]
MHYIIHVFTEPGGDVEKAMEPFRERYDEDDNWTGEWDWWVTGGRWEGYFNGENAAPAAQVLAMDTRFDSPYAYLTLDGRWLPKEEYVPGGFPDPTETRPDRVSHFREIPGYVEGYRAYLTSVPEGTVVTTVDIHS